MGTPCTRTCVCGAAIAHDRNDAEWGAFGGHTLARPVTRGACIRGTNSGTLCCRHTRSVAAPRAAKRKEGAAQGVSWVIVFFRFSHSQRRLARGNLPAVRSSPRLSLDLQPLPHHETRRQCAAPPVARRLSHADRGGAGAEERELCFGVVVEAAQCRVCVCSHTHSALYSQTAAGGEAAGEREPSAMRFPVAKKKPTDEPPPPTHHTARNRARPPGRRHRRPQVSRVMRRLQDKGGGRSLGGEIVEASRF